MPSFSSFLSLAVLAAVARSVPLERRAVAYYNPNNGGGSEVDIVSPGLGEPLNVILSGLSDPSVLSQSGFLTFAQDIGFSTECLGIHIGAAQQANLGDGNGAVNQVVEYRENYPAGGTCLESLIGGNHLRGWIQNGPNADSGAWFLAVSNEEDASDNHDIVPNGYDIGRDNLVANVKAWAADQSTYTATVEYVTGLLPAGSNGINHGISQDGQVAVVTVTLA